jgi:transposase
MKPPEPKIIELEAEELEALLQRVEAALSQDDAETIRAVVESHACLAELLEAKGMTIERLQKLLFGSRTEKTRDVIPPPADATPPAAAQDHTAPTEPEENEAAKRKGHGRNGADAYRGAEKIRVPHDSLHAGDACPDCTKGTVYSMARPKVLVRVIGQAPVQAKVYEMERLRCNLCGQIFTARTPEGVGAEKYDVTSASMIALLKYGSGLPFNRLEGLQGNLGIPLPASTQWDIVNEAAEQIEPVYKELIRQAAQGEVLHNDDTTMKILNPTGKRADGEADAADTPQRKGVFTSGIVSTNQGRQIALFFTGPKHAGENLAEVLRHRAAALEPPIQMCDALSRNLPGEFKTIVANCLAHGRRPFVEAAAAFPEECRHVLERLGEVYRNDAEAREQGLSPDARLRFHQAESSPIMDDLHAWLDRQFEDRRVEPNSSLGQAIAYLLRHWEKLTLFLRVPGTPLDNNIVERALKHAILHRKNALFYLTEHGAHVGDLYMSLIHTCRLGGVDPFDYLTKLQRHADELSSQPHAWMPWTYRDALEQTPTSPTTAR